MSVTQPQWLAEVEASYEKDEHAQAIIAKLLLDSQSVPHFTFSNGILRYKSRIWIGQVQSLHNQLISALHTTAMGGHSGISVTLRRLKQFFAWHGINKAVHEFVSACTICQQAKPDRTKLPGLLQPLPVPDRAWKVISLDFIEGLPVSGSFNCILVVVCLFKVCSFHGFKASLHCGVRLSFFCHKSISYMACLKH